MSGIVQHQVQIAVPMMRAALIISKTQQGRRAGGNQMERRHPRRRRFGNVHAPGGRLTVSNGRGALRGE
jgi:hypothetical protein